MVLPMFWKMVKLGNLGKSYCEFWQELRFEVSFESKSFIMRGEPTVPV